MSTSRSERYTNIAIALHWLIAALVAAQIGWGWWMQEIPKQPVGPRVDAFNLHKSVGLTLLALTLLRLGWRLSAAAAAAGVASEARGRHSRPAVRVAAGPPARWLSGLGMERLSGQVLRDDASGVGLEGRRPQGPLQHHPLVDESRTGRFNRAARGGSAEPRADPPQRTSGENGHWPGPRAGGGLIIRRWRCCRSGAPIRAAGRYRCT
ncbi:MAG: hypothetical protein GZ089_11935 [Aromatoleum sp.]|nr:hypothetical protein [Aromatoleum sp.]